MRESTGGSSRLHYRRPGLLATILVAALLAAGGMVTMFNEAVDAQPDPLVIVSLGDSFISGTGAENYYPNQGPGFPDGGGEQVPRDGKNCYQSYSSYPWQYTQKLNDASHPAEIWHAACDGAVTYDLRPQWLTLPDIRNEADIILLSAGGNDAGFGDLVEDCVTAGVNPNAAPQDCDGHLAFATSELPLLLDRLETEARWFAAQAVNARIVLMGYPDLLSPLEQTCQGALGVTQIQQLQLEHDLALTQLAQQLNDEGPNRFHVSLPRDRFVDQGPCADTTLLFHGPGVEGEFHPTALGHEALAQLLFDQGLHLLGPIFPEPAAWSLTGIVTDSDTGEPVDDATVVLHQVASWTPGLGGAGEQQCQNNGGPWTQAAPTDIGVEASAFGDEPDGGNPDIEPDLNPLTTTADGSYEWDVAEGCWYVMVSADGFETQFSPVAGVPPAAATLDVALIEVNEPPMATDDAVETAEDVAFSFDVIAGTNGAMSDSDPENGLLELTAVDASQVGAALEFEPSGLITYTPATNFHGVDNFDYTVMDEGGNFATATVTVRVFSVPDEPSARDDGPITIELATSQIVDVLLNDTGNGSDEITDVVITAAPSAGTASVVGQSILVAAGNGPPGETTLTYQACSTISACDSATVELVFVLPEGQETCNGRAITLIVEAGVPLHGTAGDDVILGSPGDDIIDGLAGNDTVCAGSGNDVIIGGDGDDTILGEAGNDIARGNAGADTIRGGSGDDRLLGGIGSDALHGDDGADYLGGFGDDDELDGGAGDDTIFGGFGADNIHGGDGHDVIRGLIGDDTIHGGPGNDTLDGDRGGDVLTGGSGDDEIRGGNANDVLDGGPGDDALRGGKADDQLSGGADTDVCVGNKEIVADTADTTCETVIAVP